MTNEKRVQNVFISPSHAENNLLDDEVQQLVI